MAITHEKDLTGPDGTRPNRAQPSDWTADHVVDLSDYAGDPIPDAAVPASHSGSTHAATQAAAEATAAAANTADIATHAADADAHHAKYTDAEAVAAVQAEAPLDLPSDLTVDTIAESTAAAGVTVDGVLLKDNDVQAADVRTDLLNEKTGAAGITVGHLLDVSAAGINFGDEDLDTFDTGVWTPALSFVTPGDISVAYSVQAGVYTRIGPRVFCDFTITTSTFTYSSASGLLVLSGFPFSSALVQNPQGVITMKGHSIGLAQWITLQLNAAASTAYFSASRDNTSLATLSTSHIASGSSLIVRGSLSYTV